MMPKAKIAKFDNAPPENKSRKPIKILGDGDLKKKLTVKASAFTTGARRKIEEAGGKVEVLS